MKAESKQVVISVTDTGGGKIRENLKHVFEKFTRVDNELSDTISGTSLGLYWVTQIIERRSGTTWLLLELRKGSVFTITLPR